MGSLQSICYARKASLIISTIHARIALHLSDELIAPELYPLVFAQPFLLNLARLSDSLYSEGLKIIDMHCSSDYLSTAKASKIKKGLRRPKGLAGEFPLGALFHDLIDRLQGIC
jgi:hypothetical protein